MNSIKLILIFTLMLAVVSVSCKKSINPEDKEFCSFVSKKNFEATGPLIDNYLRGQNSGLASSEQLSQLKDWLSRKNCILNVEVLCNSCIYTNPGQSELKVTFFINGTRSEKVLDIIMGSPCRFGAYHE